MKFTAVQVMAAIGVGLYSILQRFKHPGLTETQLFLLDWKLYLGVWLCMVLLVLYVWRKDWS